MLFERIISANIGFLKWLYSDEMIKNMIPIVLSFVAADIINILVDNILVPIVQKDRWLYRLLKPFLQIIGVMFFVYTLYILRNQYNPLG